MRGFLLDTNCISEDTRPKPNAGVSSWLKRADSSTLFLSVLTLGEIRKGITGLAAGRRRAQLEMWLETGLQVHFGSRILPIDGPVAERWGYLEAEARRMGKGIPTIDGLLAATALEHNLTIVSRNTRDFAATQVPVFNPWI